MSGDPKNHIRPHFFLNCHNVWGWLLICEHHFWNMFVQSNWFCKLWDFHVLLMNDIKTATCEKQSQLSFHQAVGVPSPQAMALNLSQVKWFLSTHGDYWFLPCRPELWWVWSCWPTPTCDCGKQSWLLSLKLRTLRSEGLVVPGARVIWPNALQANTISD